MYSEAKDGAELKLAKVQLQCKLSDLFVKLEFILKIIRNN